MPVSDQPAHAPSECATLTTSETKLSFFSPVPSALPLPRRGRFAFAATPAPGVNDFPRMPSVLPQPRRGSPSARVRNQSPSEREKLPAGHETDKGGNLSTEESVAKPGDADEGEHFAAIDRSTDGILNHEEPIRIGN